MLNHGKTSTRTRLAKLAPVHLDEPGRVLYSTYKLINLVVKMQVDRLSSTFSALADPTRRAILARLSSGECSVTELAEPFEMSLPAVSKHLRVLERAGLVTRRRDAQWRHCSLEAGPLKEVADWTDHYRRLWEERLDRLGDYLNELQAKEKSHARKHPKQK
jgi:DNA-binding transcriptional ArsR family regulator